MMKAEWIDVSYRDINQPTMVESSNGSKTQFMLSPADIPKSYMVWTGSADNEKSYIVIKFKYLSESEPISETILSNSLTVSFGSKSRRIYQFTIQMDKDSLESLKKPKQALDLAEKEIELKDVIFENISAGNKDAIRRIFLTN